MSKVKPARSLHAIRSIRNNVHTEDAKSLYYTLVYPYLTYGIEVWGAANKNINNILNKLEVKNALKCVSALWGAGTLPRLFLKGYLC